MIRHREGHAWTLILGAARSPLNGRRRFLDDQHFLKIEARAFPGALAASSAKKRGQDKGGCHLEWRVSEGAGWGHTPGFRGCAKTIENISRIRMVVARASGADLASSLKQNTFLTLGVRPVGGPCAVA